MDEEHRNLHQLHWQSKTPPYDVMEFKSQKTINSPEEMTDWCKDVDERSPLPDGMCWVVLEWNHKSFVKTAKGVVREPVDPPRLPSKKGWA